MTRMESVAVTAQATFGRDGAMFESLLGFVAQLSLVLWSLVILTAVIRFVGIRIYRRGAARTAEGPAPDAVSTKVPRRTFRNRRRVSTKLPRRTFRTRRAARRPAFATNSREA